MSTIEQAARIAINCTATDDGCWVWQGSLDKDGYGRATSGGENVIVHRHMLHLFTGITGTMACHTCARRACCNPAHLYWGDAGSNAKDMMDFGHAAGQFGMGSTHPAAKLTEAQVAIIRATPKVRGSGKALAEKFGVSKVTISTIRSGKVWKGT